YKGGIDAFVARLIDSTSTAFNCPAMRFEGYDTADVSDALSVYPNPSNEYFNVQIVAETESDLVYHVYDNLGRIILSSQQHLVAGSNRFTIDLKEYPAGLYILRTS